MKKKFSLELNEEQVNYLIYILKNRRNYLFTSLEDDKERDAVLEILSKLDKIYKEDSND